MSWVGRNRNDVGLQALLRAGSIAVGRDDVGLRDEPTLFYSNDDIAAYQADLGARANRIEAADDVAGIDHLRIEAICICKTVDQNANWLHIYWLA